MHRPLILKRSSLVRAGFDDYDVLSEGKLVGRIYEDRTNGSWFWSVAYGNHRDRFPPHGYEESPKQQ